MHSVGVDYKPREQCRLKGKSLPPQWHLCKARSKPPKTGPQSTNSRLL